MKFAVPVSLGCALMAGSLAMAQTLTKVDIAPPEKPATPAVGTYTTGAGGTFTITSDGTGYYPNMTWPEGKNSNLNLTGDVATMAYETLTGDFDRCVKITSIAADVFNPGDLWTRGGLMVRTSTEHYAATFELAVANPATGGANQVRFSGRALDGAHFTDWGRDYAGVDKVLPNQWIRLSRVGDYFAVYVGTNGTTWSKIGQRYQEWPATLYVGPYAASGTEGTIATVKFASYGATPVTDTTAPKLVSAGTLDKKLVGVKFSEAVNSATAKVAANYVINQGAGAVTINSVKMGIGGDAVYLNVSGLTKDTFTVTVVGGIKDSAGNTITPNTSVSARALGWNAIDLGNIQNPASRPTPGDDPYRVGQSVMVSSDENPEVEVIGGGSNQWNPGDYVHYIYRSEPLSGNFDVTIAVSRFDRSVRQGGYSNSGLMLRASPYLAGQEYTPAGTKVPMVALPTYIEASGPGRGAIPLWRTTDGGGYGNGNAGFSWQTLIGGVKGYYADLRAIDASGAIDPASSDDTARYLRIKRVGGHYTFYASWNRKDWAIVGEADLPLPDRLLLGFSTMTDSGAFNPPLSAYGQNGHMINPDDPLNPCNFDANGNPTDGATDPGRSFMNESCYAVQKIKIFPNGVSDPLPASLALADLRPADGSSVALSGTWTSTGTYSFDMTGGGTGVFRNLPAPADGTTGGDELSFAWEKVVGDFDKQIKITSLSTVLYNYDGSAYTPAEGDTIPVDSWARAGLMARSGTNSYDQSLKILAANPAGANVVRVVGRGLDAQNYTQFSGDYAGVTNALPNQWLRMKRAGHSFTFYVSKDGVVWSLIARRFQEMPAELYFGPYVAGSLNPDDTVNNPLYLLSRAAASFTAYNDVDLGDLTKPTVVSAGTIDKKTVGVKFSEIVSSASATIAANYKLSQGTVTAAKMGVLGDSVYLTVSGLTADTFTVTVDNVADTAGNVIAAASVVSAKASNWKAADVGFIQNPTARPTPGDDPYRVGQTVATSSESAPDLEVIGGGSNTWNPGDFLHYVYDQTPLTGDFDVAVKVAYYERPNTAGQGGYSNSGLMLRAGVYNEGEEYTIDGTKVPMVSNNTYCNYAGGPGRGGIPLWRTEIHGGYGNGNAGYGWGTVINGLKGYYAGINATDSVGTPDPQSSPYTAHWLRIARTGTDYMFYISWNGIDWDRLDGPTSLPSLPDKLYFGYSTMNDSGAGTPPFGAYGPNGHTLDPLDPLNPINVGGTVMNESNYTVTKIRMYRSIPAITQLSAAVVGGKVVVSYTAGTLATASKITGPWTPLGPQPSPYVVTPPAGAATVFYRIIP
jgi:regulation of enolase protein 1 (concanavalin A-like superfamily)